MLIENGIKWEMVLATNTGTGAVVATVTGIGIHSTRKIPFKYLCEVEGGRKSFLFCLMKIISVRA